MRLFVTHDQDVNIVSVNLPQPTTVGNIGPGEVSISAEPGHAVCEVEAPGLRTRREGEQAVDGDCRAVPCRCAGAIGQAGEPKRAGAQVSSFAVVARPMSGACAGRC